MQGAVAAAQPAVYRALGKSLAAPLMPADLNGIGPQTV